MARRSYEQSCSLANALDRVGERWTMLIVRELALGPLRFSDLLRGVGGAPSDVLTRRLRDLDADGIVRQRILGPPVSATVYELTALGRELERPMLELGRWGLHFFTAEDAVAVDATTLPNALRVILVPPPNLELLVAVRCDGHPFHLRIEGGWIEAARGETEDPGLTLIGDPAAVITTLVLPEVPAAAEVAGDPALLDRLRRAVVLPDRLRSEAEAIASARA